MEWSIWRVERRESKTKMNKRKQEISYARMPQFLRIPSIKSERKNKRMHNQKLLQLFFSSLFFFCFSLYVLVFALCIFKYKYYLDCNSHLFNRRTIKTKHRNRFGERSEFEASKASDIQKKIANERKRNCERKKDEEKLNEWGETKRNRKKHQPFFRMAFFGMCTQYTLDRSATSHGFSARKLFWRFFRRLLSDLLHFFSVLTLQMKLVGRRCDVSIEIQREKIYQKIELCCRASWWKLSGGKKSKLKLCCWLTRQKKTLQKVENDGLYGTGGQPVLDTGATKTLLLWQ